MSDKLLNIFNRNVSLDNKYTSNEIRMAFLKTDYSLGTKREQHLYIRFFKECNNNDDIEILKTNYETTIQKIKKLYKSFSDEKKIEFGKFWFKRFNLPILIGNILPRTNEKYTQIDNFELYELTPCTSYEMAIRNKNVKRLLQMNSIISDMCTDNKYLSKSYFGKHNYKERFNHPIIEFKDEYKDLNFQEYENKIRQKHYNYSKLIENDYKKFIDNYIYICTELDIRFLLTLKKKIEDELINQYLIYPKGFKRTVPCVNSLYKEEVLNLKKENGIKIIDNDSASTGCQIRYEETTYDEFIQVQAIHVSDNEYYLNNIIPNFSRQINEQNKINIAIDFSLPIEEIEEYIRKVKKRINFKTPFELLGNSLKEADSLTNINTLNKKNKEIALDMTRGEKPQEKIADLFYIYDMRERGFSNTEIAYELENKYSNKNTSISENTIKKYYTIAKEYIDNEKYKELITGKKYRR